MKYTFDGKYHKISKVTGPRHNFLSVAIGENAGVSEKFTITDLNRDKPFENKVSELSVRHQLLSGLELINKQLLTDYCIISAQFISSDTPSEKIYHDLIVAIIEIIKNNALQKNTNFQ